MFNFGSGSGNTFGSTQTPFGSTQTPLGSTQTPFGSTQSQLPQSAFTQSNQPTQTPFTQSNQTTQNPFTQSNQSSFTHSSQTPFAQTPSNQNPFSTPNPFAQQSPQTTQFQSPQYGPFGTPASSASAASANKISISSTQELHPLVQLQHIFDAFNRESPFYKFKHIFYNIVPTQDLPKYEKPANIDELMWKQALADNPNPASMVPVVALGFEDLGKREEAQQSRLKVHQAKLGEVKGCLEAFQRVHAVEYSSKISQIERKQAALNSSLVKILKQYQILKSKGFTFSKEEEQLKLRLEGLQSKMNRALRLREKAGEISHLIPQLQQAESHALEEEVSLSPASIDSLNESISSQNAAISVLLNDVAELQKVESKKV